MTNNAMSPVLTCLGEIGDSHGKLLVRAMGFGGRYCARFDAALDAFNERHYIASALLNTAAGVSYLLAMCISAGTSFFLLRHWSTTPAKLGLALTYSFLLPYFLQVFAMIMMMFTVAITSLERLLQCQGEGVPQEPAWELPSDVALLARGWPGAGGVRFEDVSLVYRPGLPPAVDRCSFDVPGGARVGVVGRTGAGKSSLFVLLFRLRDAREGCVWVDGEAVRGVGLGTLRRRLAIIPQDPLLLEGTVADNVDPFGEHAAERVGRTLDRVGLSGREGTDPKHLSAGERQLLQMARTLLRDVRVVVMDEPTSNIDPQTDAAVQRVVREDFRGCTVITVAHRLDTVIDGDRILVMERGRVAEYGAPCELLTRRGAFSAMVDGQGAARAEELRAKAAAAAPDLGPGAAPAPEEPVALDGDLHTALDGDATPRAPSPDPLACLPRPAEPGVLGNSCSRGLEHAYHGQDPDGIPSGHP